MREVSEALYLYLGSSFMSVCFCKNLLSYMLRINVICYILYIKVYIFKKNPRSLLASNGYLPPSLRFQLLQHYQPLKEQLEGRKEGEKRLRRTQQFRWYYRKPQEESWGSLQLSERLALIRGVPSLLFSHSPVFPVCAYIHSTQASVLHCNL